MNKLGAVLALILISSLAFSPNISKKTTAEILYPDTQVVLAYDWKFGTDQAKAGTGLEKLDVSDGCDVNADGFDDILVSRRDYDSLQPNNGIAWLFFGSATGLSATPDLTFYPPLENENGIFGAAIACAGDVDGDGDEELMIGMDNYDFMYSDEGAVFVYYGSPTGMDTTYDWMARGNVTYAHLGGSLDGAGDVNGDGFDDIIVGTIPAYSANDAVVWYGSAAGLGEDSVATSADWYANGPDSTFANLVLVRGIGDIQNDGNDDVLVGAWNYDGAKGMVYVWYASDTVGLGTANRAPDWSAAGDQLASRFGWGGDGVGDLNGDGYADLAIGSFLYDNPDASEGKIFVWYGDAAGLGSNGTPANADWTAESDVTNAQLGMVVRPGGDINQDGYDDLLAGAHGFSYDTLTSTGAWFVWTGSSIGLGDNGTPANADLAGYGDQTGGVLGHSEVSAGDVNGDGLDEIFAAALNYDDGELDEGVVFGYYYAGPVSANDSFKVFENDVLTVGAPGVLANDTLGDGIALVAILLLDANHGTLSLNANGSFSYTPDADFTGTDSFTYEVNDGLVESESATVTITVNEAFWIYLPVALK